MKVNRCLFDYHRSFMLFNPGLAIAHTYLALHLYFHLLVPFKIHS